jgi:protease-4
MAKRGLAILFTLLGILVAMSLVAIVALYFLFSREPSVPSRAVLRLEIGGDIPETAPTDVIAYVRGGARTPTVGSIVETLHKAKADRRIAAVFLEPTGFGSPYWGKVQEIRDAVSDFRSSGKVVYAYLENADERNYYLATAADRIFLMPSTTLDLTGVATYALFLRGTFDKIGVVPDMHHIGQYKTAVNTFTEKTYTPAHREMDESLNRDLFDQIVRAVAESRKMTDAEVRTLVDDGPFLPEAAKKAGLVDEIAYEDQAFDTLKQDRGANNKIDGDDYARISPTSVGLNRGPRIAVIYASGAIAGGRGGFDPLNGESLGSETLIEAIRDARNDSSARAIVLRIDSPGGSATASDAIWRELMIARQQRQDRPLIVSMGDLAASGGYYIAMPGQVIVAQPSTLTGSIGIFGGKLVTGGTYEKLGAHIDATSIGRNAEMDSPTRPFTPSESQKLDEQLQAFYGDFVRKAAESRHTTREKIDSLGQGRVWTGRQAKENGLVDELGGLDRAIAIAKARAKIPERSGVEIVTYPRPKSFYELVSQGLSGTSDAAVSAWVGAHVSADELDVLRALRGPSARFRRGELLALMPFTYLR